MSADVKARKDIPSTVVVEVQKRFWELKDQIKPGRERAAQAQKAADIAKSDADYLEHKVHALAVFLDEECDVTEYLLSVLDDLTVPRDKCVFCAEEQE